MQTEIHFLCVKKKLFSGPIYFISIGYHLFFKLPKLVIDEFSMFLYEFFHEPKILFLTVCLSITYLLIKIPARVPGALMRGFFNVKLLKHHFCLRSITSETHLFIHSHTKPLIWEALIKIYARTKETDKRHNPWCQEVAWLADGIS